MTEPTTTETETARRARRLAEAPARDHYWQTWGYARSEGWHEKGQGTEHAHRVTLGLLHVQAAQEDRRRSTKLHPAHYDATCHTPSLCNGLVALQELRAWAATREDPEVTELVEQVGAALESYRLD